MAKKNTGGSASNKSKKNGSKTEPKETASHSGSTTDSGLGSSSDSGLENDSSGSSTDLGLGSSTDSGLGDDAVEQIREENDEELKSAADEAQGVKEQFAEVNKSIAIIIPYKESSAKGSELLYALRAWDKFLPNASIIIVGDFPDFLDTNKVGHIPHTPTSTNPQIDVAQKLLLACESDLVPEAFIISNDDIYPVCPITLTDIDVHVAMGRLGSRGSVGSIYRKNAANTLTALKKEGVTAPFDYATHTPVLVWKEELRSVINKFKAYEVGHLVSTLYFNTVWPGHRPIIVDIGITKDHPGTQSYVGSVFRANTNNNVLRQAFASRKFINNNDAGWDAVEPHLKKLFPKKSSFEK